ALARDDDAGAHIAVIDTPADVELSPLLAWLSEPEAPYVVMHDAQTSLHALQPAAAAPATVWAPARLGDTEIAARLLAAAAGRSRAEFTLPHCVARVLKMRLASGERARGRVTPNTNTKPTPNPTELAASAASTLMPLMRALTPLLRRTELTRSHDLEASLVPAVLAMERTGFGIDAVGFQRIADSWARERAGDPAPDRIARLDKLLSTYAHWPRDFARRGRIHSQLHPLAAESGRFSCTDPNLQQVPGQYTAPGLRECFVPAPGYCLVVADYAQIELRVAAHLAPCDALRAVFHEGRDPHRATAATITGKPEAEVSSHERKLAKAVNFGFLFGMGARRFASYARDSYGVEVSDAEAKQARQAFFDTYPGVSAWHRRVGALGRGVAVTVRTVLGRRKKFASDKFSFNAALNIPVQGTAAEGFKRAMIDLYTRLPEVSGRGVLVVHDEYIAEIPEDRAEEGRALVESVMATAMATVVSSVPIVVEARVAAHWS
ncbi:MAG: hypothetical protein JKY37_28865, partial [Nannocystaceae bacterium]|nr:hypothetical protein [Nannocystaceae bacterium]